MIDSKLTPTVEKEKGKGFNRSPDSSGTLETPPFYVPSSAAESRAARHREGKKKREKGEERGGGKREEPAILKQPVLFSPAIS